MGIELDRAVGLPEPKPIQIEKEDPSDPDHVAEEEKRFDPRGEAMGAIVARRKQEIEEGDEVNLSVETGPRADPPEVVATVLAEELKEIAGGFVPDVPMRVKVDGEEIDLQPNEVLRHLQKSVAADKRLNDAAMRLKEIEAREQAVAEAERRLAEASQTTPVAPDPVVPQVQKQPKEVADPMSVVEKIVNSMLEGNTDDAIAELTAATQAAAKAAAPAQPKADMSAILAQVPTQSDIEKSVNAAVAAASWKAAFDNFVVDPQNKDIVGDQVLAKVCDQYLDHFANGEARTPTEAYRLAADATLKWAQNVVARTGPNRNREALKLTLDNVVGLNFRADPVPSAPVEATAESRVNTVLQMQKARGQA